MVFEHFSPDDIVWLYAIDVLEHFLIHEIYLLLIILKDLVKVTWATDDPHSESVKIGWFWFDIIEKEKNP